MEIKIILVSMGQEQELSITYYLRYFANDVILQTVDQIKFQVWTDGHLRQEKIFSLSESNHYYP